MYCLQNEFTAEVKIILVRKGFNWGSLKVNKIQSHKKVTVSFRILVFVFNIEYIYQFSTKCKNQGQF